MIRKYPSLTEALQRIGLQGDQVASLNPTYLIHTMTRAKLKEIEDEARYCSTNTELQHRLNEVKLYTEAVVVVIARYFADDDSNSLSVITYTRDNTLHAIEERYYGELFTFLEADLKQGE